MMVAADGPATHRAGSQDATATPGFRVVIVGGGSAGWITAARIAAAQARGDGDVRVTLIESPNTPPIGVGEGTWPTMRNTLMKMGIAEDEFLRATDATFKQGARFAGWTQPGGVEAYYHPLNAPVGAGEEDMASLWTALHAEGAAGSFADTVDFQAALCDAGRAPKPITAPAYRGTANYAYHLDAGKFAALLSDHAIGKLGVEHLRLDIVSVEQADNGDITTLVAADGTRVDGDFFIDCSGLKGLLIGGVYGVPLASRRDILFADKALALQVPYDHPDAPIACQTIATAQDAGWIWDIGLWSRRGLGHVYSSAHTSDDEAEAALRRYAGPIADNLTCRRLDINVGERTVFWQNNCVAIGLSGGFVEPLEASSLMLVELAVDSIADRLPRTQAAMRSAASQFNRAFTHHWQRVIEFLKLHYVLTKRTDTDFWRDNVRPESIPDGLAERLEMWRTLPPGPQDFPHAPEVFSWPSYQYVLHGMGFDAAYARPRPASPAGTSARRLLDRASTLRAQALAQLPDHRTLVRGIREHGVQAI